MVDAEVKEDQQFYNMNIANDCGFNGTVSLSADSSASYMNNVIWISISYKNNHKSADHIYNELSGLEDNGKIEYKDIALKR